MKFWSFHSAEWIVDEWGRVIGRGERERERERERKREKERGGIKDNKEPATFPSCLFIRRDVIGLSGDTRPPLEPPTPLLHHPLHPRALPHVHSPQKSHAMQSLHWEALSIQYTVHMLREWRERELERREEKRREERSLFVSHPILACHAMPSIVSLLDRHLHHNHTFSSSRFHQNFKYIPNKLTIYSLLH